MITLFKRFASCVTKETVLRACARAVHAFITGALGSFAVINFVVADFSEPKKLLYSVVGGMIVGGLQGLQKLISGYLKYDKPLV